VGHCGCVVLMTGIEGEKLQRNARTVGFAAATTLAVMGTVAISGSLELGRKAGCEAPELFGICNPFVPGTIVASRGQREPIRVVSTWPDGPAERAGVCPGDYIVRVNSVSASDNVQDRMLRELVSGTRRPVLLRIKRAEKEFEFKVQRVRETSLANASKRKFLSWRASGANQVLLAPLDERRDELLRFASFHARLDAKAGFRWLEGTYVPAAASEAQIRQLNSLVSSRRVQGRAEPDLKPQAYTPGFTTLVLANPTEIFIERVEPESLAHRAGILPGDQILEVDGRAVSGLSVEDVQRLLYGPEHARDIELIIKRSSFELAFNLKTQLYREVLESSPSTSLPALEGPLSADDYILGLRVLYARDTREAIVEDVQYPSPAFDQGMHPGDPILAVNGTPIEALSSEQIGRKLLPAGPLETTVVVSRLGRTITFRLMPVTYGRALASIGRKLGKFGPTPQHCP